MRPSPASFALLLFLAPHAFAQDRAAPATERADHPRAGDGRSRLDRPADRTGLVVVGRPARVHAAQAHGRDDPRHVRAADRRAARPRCSMAPRAPTPTPQQPVYDAQRTRMAFVRNGDVFVRDLRSGALQQITRTNDDEVAAAVGQRRRPCRGAWATTGIAGPRADGVRQAAIVLAEKSPDTKPESRRPARTPAAPDRHAAQRPRAARRRARAGRGLAPRRSDARAGRRPTSAPTSRSPTARFRPTAAGCSSSPRRRAPTPGRQARCRST